MPAYQRDTQRCTNCDAKLERFFALPHIAPIGGIYNRLNKNWREGGRVIDTHAVDELVDNATKE